MEDEAEMAAFEKYLYENFDIYSKIECFQSGREYESRRMAVSISDRDHAERQLAKIVAENMRQSEHVKRLVEALQDFIYRTTCLSPEEDDGSHWCRIPQETLTNARQALAPFTEANND